MNKILIIILLIIFAQVKIIPVFTIKHTNLNKFGLSENKIENVLPSTVMIGATASSAFTLAEIMIAVTVVGVAAALVIPPVIQNIQDQQNKVS